MKILFLTTHLNSGGITSYLYSLTKGLVRRGHHVSVVTSGGDMEISFEEIGAEVINLNIKTKSELSLKIYFALRPLVKLIKARDIDVIHSNTRITQVMGYWLGLLTKVKTVSTCHGFFKPRLWRKLFQCWGDKAIAISPPVFEHLQKDLNVNVKKICLIEHGIDLDVFSCADESVRAFKRKEFGFTYEPVIGIIARLSDVKGQDILICAMKQVVAAIPNAKLLIVGLGKTEGVLKGIVDKLDLNRCIKFYPVVNQTPELLPMFDVFVMPSRMEGLGLSVMEAQASGIPVIASNVGGIPNLIEHGKTGYLVDPENIEDLAQTIINVLSNRESAKAVGFNGRKFAEQECSFDKMIAKTINLYESVLRNS